MNVPFSAVLRELMAVGVAGEELLAAIERLEATMQPAEQTRSARQERNRRHYEKRLKASERRLNASEPSESSESSESDASAEKVSPEPSSKNPTPFSPPTGDSFPLPFDQAWEAYPAAGRRRSSTKKSKPEWARASKAAGAERLRDAVRRYAESPDAADQAGKFVPAFDRWLRDGKWEHWLEDEPPKPTATVTELDPWPQRLREFHRNAYWNTTDWGPKPGKPGCRVPPEYLTAA